MSSPLRSPVAIPGSPPAPGSAAARQEEIWNTVADGWSRWSAEYESAAGPVTDALLSLGAAAPGGRVLDVGCGLGVTSRAAARAVSPDGSVVGIDVSAAMIAGAERDGTDEGNIAFVHGDVDTTTLPPAAFDAVISRWGLMFSPDRVATFTRLRRTLRPGGRLAAAVWGPPAEVPMISLGFRVISEELGLTPPPPGGPGPFSMTDPDAVTAELVAAGFEEISIGTHVVPFRMSSVSDVVLFTHDVLPPGMRAAVAQRRGRENDPAVWQAVAAAAADLVDGGDAVDGGGDGTDPSPPVTGQVYLPSTCVLLRAVAPGR